MANPKVALVGGESLLGQDVLDVFRERLPKVDVKLVGSEDAAILTADAGEAVVMTGLDGDALAEADVIVLAGGPESTAKALEMLDETLEPGDRRPAVINLADAHPVALVLGRFLRELHARFPIVRCVAKVFTPASERGRAGVNELHQQTSQLFTFKPIDKTVFGDQLAFNMLVGQVDTDTIERHLKPLLGGAPMPSLRAIQVSVMHGLSFSLWVEFTARPEVEALAALQSDDIDFRGPGLDPPNPVGIVGLDGIFVGSVERDRQHPNGMWLWLAADNFRVAAVNAARVVESLLRP